MIVADTVILEVSGQHLAEEIEDMKMELELETDGRWIAEAPDLPGVMTYGKTREEAICKVEALALRVLADKLEHGEEFPKALAMRRCGG